MAGKLPMPSVKSFVSNAWSSAKEKVPKEKLNFSNLLRGAKGPPGGGRVDEGGATETSFLEGGSAGARGSVGSQDYGTSSGQQHQSLGSPTYDSGQLGGCPSYGSDGIVDKLNGKLATVELEEGEGGFDEFGGGKDKIDEWQAGWNVTNAIQGMFIVSLPYAVLHGGYWAILAMTGIAYICCYTGKILVECLYETDENGFVHRVRDSYVAVAKECFGPFWGGKIVNTAQIIELLMTCILYIVLCGDLMIGSFPEGAVDARSWMMICGMILIPCSFLKDLHAVSLLSFWCSMSHIAINVIILGYCILCIGTWGWSKVSFTLDIYSFPIALGIIVFSYTSQIFLPTLEGNMIDKTKFHDMMKWSHLAAAAFKSVFGYVGFLTWQESTQEVITNNLPSQGFKAFVNFILVIKALLSYPLPYYAACDLIERACFKGQPQTPFPVLWDRNGDLKVWGLAVKVGVILFTIILAIFIPHFAILMGFIGSFTGTMLSFIWPCYFHLKIKGHTLDWFTVAYDCFVIFLGCTFGIIGIYYSGRALIRAFQIGLPF